MRMRQDDLHRDGKDHMPMRTKHRDSIPRTGQNRIQGYADPEGRVTLKTTLAKQWKNWKLNRLRMEIEIQERLLRLARNEYAALNKLEGKALAYRFGAESAADLKPFEEDREKWVKQIEGIFIVADILDGLGLIKRKAAA